MADNVRIYQPEPGPNTVDTASDEVAGEHYQRVKVAYGPEDEASLVSGASPLPVADPFAGDMQSPRHLQYARDNLDQMRVAVASLSALIAGTATVGNVALTWGLRDTYPSWYGQGAPGSMDAREQQRETSIQTFQGEMSKWTFT